MNVTKLPLVGADVIIPHGIATYPTVTVPLEVHRTPRLILSLEDSTGEHKFKAVGLKKDEFPFRNNKKSNPIRTNRKNMKTS